MQLNQDQTTLFMGLSTAPFPQTQLSEPLLHTHWISQDKQEFHSRGPTQLGHLGIKPEPLPDPAHTRHSLILYLLAHSWWLA